MGYTHYWKITAGDDENWVKAMEFVTPIVKASGLRISGWGHSGRAEGEYDGFQLNGAQPDDYETFHLTSDPVPNEFTFCKTARKPYDVVVTAILATFAHFAPDSIEVTSGGEPLEWVEGVKLARKVTGEKVGFPPGVNDPERFVDSYRPTFDKNTAEAFELIGDKPPVVDGAFEETLKS